MKAGDYARNKYGIGKILEVNKHGKLIELIFDKFTMPIEDINGKIVGQMSNKFIINTDYEPEDFKSSPNIIDLIEIGDYVNGEKVTDKFDYLLVFDNADYYKDENEIKSIVTKEAFENMEYKVGDE